MEIDFSQYTLGDYVVYYSGYEFKVCSLFSKAYITSISEDMITVSDMYNNSMTFGKDRKCIDVDDLWIAGIEKVPEQKKIEQIEIRQKCVELEEKSRNDYKKIQEEIGELITPLLDYFDKHQDIRFIYDNNFQKYHITDWKSKSEYKRMFNRLEV